MDADKFHANCYSFSGAVASAHFLLRRKPYNVMWGGGYVVIDDALEEVSDENVLLGISTYEDYEDFERNNKDILQKPYLDKVRFIEENNKTWQRLSVWDEALEFFNMKHTHSVPYTGYLINLTKKLAVDLADYHAKSIFFGGENRDTIITIDPVPVLTETGGGAQMAFFDGVSSTSTEELAGSWCGDLLQIADNLPNGYETIDCCFADVWKRAGYCYEMFGLNDEALIKEGDSLYKAAPLSIRGKRGALCHIKVELTEDKIKYSSVQI